jgi:hypothetical protein
MSTRIGAATAETLSRRAAEIRGNPQAPCGPRPTLFEAASSTVERMNRTYAVVWSENGSTAPGRLDALAHGFELAGRGQRLSISFDELVSASIERARTDRLRGLPVLELGRASRLPVRIASLEGTAALHELFEHVELAGAAAARNAA